jgi:hypothetical protein
MFHNRPDNRIVLRQQLGLSAYPFTLRLPEAGSSLLDLIHHGA